MYIIRILFKELPTAEEQAEIQTLFGDKYAPESTESMYVYITLEDKSEASKALLLSSIRPKLDDVNISRSYLVQTPISSQEEQAASTPSVTDS